MKKKVYSLLLFMDLEFMVKNSDLIILWEVVSDGETMDIHFYIMD